MNNFKEILDGYNLEMKIEAILQKVEDEETKSKSLYKEFQKENSILGGIWQRDSIKHNYVLRTLLSRIVEDLAEFKAEIEQKEKSVQ
ncbi:hypothetical protein BUY79_03160 [Staphylococcus equorum]|uniref:hypothetical protein n=2 Tax=Staphylococcus equorum TaxID=246432 RepID=UPI000D1CDB0C|nr:hypothetical protein [Staphylococcus equorum]PTE85080.1 hypothetical protein BUY79_03160 [Staphylococcus equorum]